MNTAQELKHVGDGFFIGRNEDGSVHLARAGWTLDVDKDTWAEVVTFVSFFDHVDDKGDEFQGRLDAVKYFHSIGDKPAAEHRRDDFERLQVAKEEGDYDFLDEPVDEKKADAKASNTKASATKASTAKTTSTTKK